VMRDNPSIARCIAPDPECLADRFVAVSRVLSRRVRRMPTHPG
jgi:hypothetical protein